MVVNEDRFFLSHRKEVALAAKKEGWQVAIVCKDTGQRAEVEALGLPMIELPVNPTGMNPFEEVRTLWFLYSLYRNNGDAIVHHVGLKAILWGGLAAKMAHVHAVVNAVSGLGTLFSSDPLPATARAVLALIGFSNRRKNVKVIFQNAEDEALFLSHHVVRQGQVEFIKGSGVDLTRFSYSPEAQSDRLKILFTARMVKEKGVVQLIEAAESLRPRYEGKVEFWLCGRLADNADAISRTELLRVCDGRFIKWLDFQSDIKPILQQSHIFAFPSYYREGVPKSLIEAAAMGRPIVTTDSIGCRDVVDDGLNGFLVPPRTSKPLAEKLQLLIDNKALRVSMGLASREKAQREFDLQKVIEKHLQIYDSLK